MILFFDTETTGFPNKKLGASDPKQAHLVQVAAQLVTPDDRTVETFSAVIASPVPSNPKAEIIHGLSHDFVQKHGRAEASVLDELERMVVAANQRVAHNLEFDDAIMKLARKREGLEDTSEMLTDKLCTMTVVKRMNLGGSNLAFCMKHFFDEDFDDHHDALSDVIACRRVFFELRRLGRM